MTHDTTDPIKLSLATARSLAVVKQGLHHRPLHADKQALLGIVRQIGLLQLDTIQVVARSHYLVMLSRVGLYDPADLGKNDKERRRSLRPRLLNIRV